LEDSRLSSIEKITLIVLLSFIIGSKNECWPSLSKIAHRASITRRSVIRALNMLERKKIITRTRRRENGTSEPTSTLYRLAGDYISLGSDTMSLEVVTECHLGSDTMSPELDNRIRKESTASLSGQKKKVLPEIVLEIEKILKAECDHRGITWEYAKEWKSIESLASLITDHATLLSLSRKFIELTKAPSGFLSGKPPTASLLKSCLATVEASMPKSSEPQKLLRKAVQAFICPKCGAQIIQGDVACQECGTLVQELEEKTV